MSWTPLKGRGQLLWIRVALHQHIWVSTTLRGPMWMPVVDTRGQVLWARLGTSRGRKTWTLLDRLWTQFVEEAGLVLWIRVESFCGYLWKRVVDISGPGLWTSVDLQRGGVWASAVDEVGSLSWRRVDAGRGQRWRCVVEACGLALWMLVGTHCGGAWTNVVEMHGSVSWARLGVLLWSPVVDEVGRGMWESTARTRGDPPSNLGVHVVGPGLHRCGQTIALPCGRVIGSTSWRVVGLCYGGAWMSFVGLCRGRRWAWNCGQAWTPVMDAQNTLCRGSTRGHPQRPCGRVHNTPPRHRSTQRPSGHGLVCWLNIAPKYAQRKERNKKRKKKFFAKLFGNQTLTDIFASVPFANGATPKVH